jgi:2-(3-amino-3-carboxypropyl)histidine synthase
MAFLLKELEEKYNLELDKIVENVNKIKKENAKVVLQFPDGLKPYAPEIVDFLESKCRNVNFVLWMESCFGACDLPSTDCDLVVQFGHTPFF